MFKQHLKSAWRNLLKYKISSILNISGIALGMAISTLIVFWVFDELNYDRYHEQIEQIYSVFEHQEYSDGQELFTGCTPFPLSGELQNAYPEVLHASTYMSLGRQTIKYENEEFKDIPVYLADTGFVEVFSFEILEGDAGFLLTPDQIAITHELSKRLFGDASPIGKEIVIYGSFHCTVSAIISAPHKNSSIRFEALLPITVAELMGANFESWGNNWPQTGLLFAEDSNPEELEGKITDMLKDKGQTNTTLHVFPYKKTRLHNYSGENNRIQYIYQFLAIGLIIILIASINFINSSIASSESRRHEVGLRKVLGASRRRLSSQFVTEKGIMILISLLIAVALVFLFEPIFNKLSGKTLSLSLLKNPYLIGSLAGLVLLTLLISVTYPSIHIASFMPIQALKSNTQKKHRRINFWSIMVTMQFTLSIMLVICTIVVSSQLRYVNTYDLGYEHENLVYIPLDEATKKVHKAFTNEVELLPGVVNLTKADKLPFYGGNSSWGFDWQGKDPELNVLICQMRVDRNYFETMGITLSEGKSFSPVYDDASEDEELKIGEIIMNAEAIKQMHMIDPVGKYFVYAGDQADIIAVTENFHFESLKRSVEPMLMVPLLEPPDVIIMRIRPENFVSTIEKIKESWAELVPDTECDLGFFDQRLQDLYLSETRIAGLFKYFSFIAIFIASIGLLGLSMFVCARRKREIGIRKVNGSTITQIILTLNKEFIIWVIISYIIASPLAWFAMNNWLQNFVYKTNIEWWMFVTAGILAFLIAAVSVSWQSWRAANQNPIEVLRTE